MLPLFFKLRSRHHYYSLGHEVLPRARSAAEHAIAGPDLAELNCDRIRQRTLTGGNTNEGCVVVGLDRNRFTGVGANCQRRFAGICLSDDADDALRFFLNWIVGPGNKCGETNDETEVSDCSEGFHG